MPRNYTTEQAVAFVTDELDNSNFPSDDEDLGAINDPQSSDEGEADSDVEINEPKQTVSSLETALDSDNYKPYIPDYHNVDETIVDDVAYDWGPPSVTAGRNNSANIVGVSPGPKKEALHKIDPLECWEVFYNEGAFQFMLEHTNRKYRNYIADIENFEEILKKNVSIKITTFFKRRVSIKKRS